MTVFWNLSFFLFAYQNLLRPQSHVAFYIPGIRCLQTGYLCLSFTIVKCLLRLNVQRLFSVTFVRLWKNITLTLYFGFFFCQQFWCTQADQKTSVNTSQGSVFLLWVFLSFDSSEIKISNGPLSQIQIFSNVNNLTFFTHI